MAIYTLDQRTIDPKAFPWGYENGKSPQPDPPPPWDGTMALPGLFTTPGISKDIALADESPLSGSKELSSVFITPDIDSDLLVEAPIVVHANGGGVAPLDCIAGGVASASSHYSTYMPGNAIDGSTSTYWRLGSMSLPQWWQVDFGSGNEKTIRYLNVYLSSYRPKGFTLQGSSDEESWTDITSGTFADVTGWQAFTFPNGNSFRYYRLLITSGYSTVRIYVYEIEMSESLGDTVEYLETLSANAPSLGMFGFENDGFVFDGWNTEEDGSGESYAADEAWGREGPIVLHAQWTPES